MAQHAEAESWPAGDTDPTRLRHALAASGMGTWRWDAATGVVDWDPMMEELSGLGPGEFGATFEAWRNSLHPDDVATALEVLDEAMARRGDYRMEHRVARPDGSVRWLECRGRVLVDDGGEVAGTIGCAIDVTDRKLAEAELSSLFGRSQDLTDRLHRLQVISGRLAVATTVDEVAEIVVEHLATPNTAGTRGVWLLDDARLTLSYVRGEGLAPSVLDTFGDVPVDAPLPLADAFRSRQTMRSGTAADLAARYPVLADVERSVDGFLAVPLMAGDDPLGVVVVGFDVVDLPELDVQFVEAAAGHIAQTIARIRLADALARRAEAAARVAEREWRRRSQLEFLGEVTQAAMAATDHEDLMAKVTAAAVPRLGDWCVLHFLPEGATTPLVEVGHVDPEMVAWAQGIRARHPYDPDAPTGVAAVIRTGITEHVEQVDQAAVDRAVEGSALAADEVREIVATLAPQSSIVAPLRTTDAVVGAMQFITSSSGEHYDADDVALAEAVADRVADALRLMWLSDQQRAIAGTLQHALLPPELPSVPGIDLAARYWPAGATNEVGGDFYDVFPLPDGEWALVIGDVCGTGADAAAVTAIARHTIRAAARHGADHAQVLEWANEAVLHSDRHKFCTVSYSTLSPEAGGWRLRMRSAGHPLGIVRRGSGAVEHVGVPGTLLGVFDEIHGEVVDTLLVPGDLLVVYTDGVTDLPPPRGATADEVADVIAAAGAGGSASGVADALRASIEARVPDASRRDDVALVVLRVVETPPA